MAISGRSRFEALTPAGDGWVQLGDTSVPAKAAFLVDGEDGSPALRVEFEAKGQSVDCTSVVVTRQPGGRGIRTGDLETVPGLDRLGVEALLNFAVTISDAKDGELPDWWNDHSLIRSRTRANLQGRGDLELQRIADIYLANIDGAPTAAVERSLGVSRRTAVRRINTARDLGYLPPTTQGKRKV